MKIIPDHAQAQVMRALKNAYLKHGVGDESIGWEELSDELSTALQEVMGDDAFCFWLESMRNQQETPK